MSTFSDQAFGLSLADLYLPFDRGMGPAIDCTVSAVRQLAPGANFSLLDIGSGPGEPACSLAAAFPRARVICSDVAPDMIARAAARATREGLTNLEVTRSSDDVPP